MPVNKYAFKTVSRGDAEILKLMDQVENVLDLTIKNQRYDSVVSRNDADPFTNPDAADFTNIVKGNTKAFKRFHRTYNNDWVLEVTYDAAQPFYDNVIADTHQREHVHQAEFLPFLQACQQAFGEVKLGSDLYKFLGKDAEAHYESRELALDRLQTATADTTRRIEDFLVKAAGDFQAKSDTLDAQYQDKVTSLEAEYQAKHNALDKRAEDLNLMEAKAERRKTIQDIIKEIDSTSDKFSLKLTASTTAMKTPVLVSAITLLGVLFLAAAFFTSWDITHPSQNWAWIRSASLSAAFVVSFVFFVRWSNDLYQQHASEEFRLKRRLLDIRRANLLIETALEWETDIKDEPLPQEIVAALSRNLFVEEGAAVISPPVATWMNALGSITGAEVQFAGNKVKVDRKGKDSKDKKTEAGEA